MSDGNSPESALTPDVAEALFIVGVILAVVLASIILPGPYPIESGGGGGGQGEGSGVGTVEATPGSGEQGEGSGNELSIKSSSPNGIGFSDPPSKTQVGSSIQEPLARAPLFVASSDERRYWRLTSYGEYTGTSWVQSLEWTPFTGSVPGDRLTTDGEEVSYGIETLVPTSALPTVWQPEDVTGLSTDTAIQVADDGGLRSSSTLQSGTTYEGRSARPAATANDLREAEHEYPAAIERRYTAVPELTPAQVGELTDSITADADSPYENAVLIRDWLQENKEYSLNASHDPGQPVVAQFLFAMDAGYCQYFASAMAVMLRTQGIPTRYVVGYAGGTDIGQNRTLVTTINGHAWVEVFFPGHGWVRFDPTPAGPLAFRNPQPPYNVSLNRTAVAGADVSITVEKNGTPVIGAPVFVGEQRVGWTDLRGTVSTRLPYKETFNITVRPPGAAGQPALSRTAEDTQGLIGGAPPTSVTDHGLRYSLGSPSFDGQQEADEPTPNQTTKTYRSDTNVTLRVSGTPRVGQTVTVSAQIADVPMRNGSVRLDGDLVGKTNETGQLALTLEGIEPGRHRVGVRRGSFSAGIQLEVLPHQTSDGTTTSTSPTTAESLDLSISTPLGWAFPLTPVTVTVEQADQPVSNATVSLDGQSVGTTDTDGSLWVWLPPRDSVALKAIGPAGATGRHGLSGLFTNLAIVLVLVGALVGASLLVRRRFDRPAGRLLAWLSRELRALKRRLLNAIVDAIDRLIGGHTTFESWIRSLGPRLAALLANLRRRGLDDWPSIDPHRLYARFLGWLVGIGATLRELFHRGGPAKSQALPDAQRSNEPIQPSVQQLWVRFIRTLSLSNVATKTPGEVARFAVNHGFPEGPVRSLTEAYRDAEYGHRQPDETLLERLREEAGHLVGPRSQPDDEGPDPP